MKKKILSKILSKSGQYNYYKKNYQKLDKENRKLKRSNKKYHNRINELELNLGKFSCPEILDKLKNNKFNELSIAIKSPHPKNSAHWGDYFFAKALKKSFEKKGFYVEIHSYEEWYDDLNFDINFVLRGVKSFTSNKDKINIMWNISHPDMISINELENYDIVFVASQKYADKIADKTNTTVKTLFQCTDPDVFYPEADENINDDILFVGVTRGVFRDIVKDSLKTNHSVSIYGKGWEKFIDKKLVKGDFIPNEELHKYYSSCKILLNDHWEDMKINDFPSNRIFDALACETFIISDKIPSEETLFEGNIVTYDSVEDLNQKLNFYLNNADERIKKAKLGKEIVLKNHTFDKRVETIIESLKML